jgi:hypothetical protein
MGIRQAQPLLGQPTSLNKEQARRSDDGTCTLVISPIP